MTEWPRNDTPLKKMHPFPDPVKLLYLRHPACCGFRVDRHYLQSGRRREPGNADKFSCERTEDNDPPGMLLFQFLRDFTAFIILG